MRPAASWIRNNHCAKVVLEVEDSLDLDKRESPGLHLKVHLVA